MAFPRCAWAGSVLASSLFTSLGAAAHPYLFFSPAEEAALQAKVQDGVPESAYSAMCTWVWTPTWPLTNSQGKCLEEVAFRYRMTGVAAWTSSVVTTLASVEGVDPGTFFDPNQLAWFGASPIPIAVAYDLVYDQLDGATRQAVVEHLEQYGVLLNSAVEGGALPPLSGDLIAAYAGLGLLALAIRNESSHPDVQQWMTTASQQLSMAALVDGWNPGGSCDEGYDGSVSGTPEALRFVEAYRRAENVDLLAGTNLEMAPAWYVYGWLPHQRHASWGTGASLMGHAFAGEHLISVGQSGDQLGKWGWQQIHGLAGIDALYRPIPLSDLLAVALWYPTELPDIADPASAGYALDHWSQDTKNPLDGPLGSDLGEGGTVYFRNGWGTDSVALAFKASDEWQPFSHNDSSSFILSAYGVEMVTDPPTAQSQDRDDHSVVLVSSHNDAAAERTSYRGAFHEVFSTERVGYAAADARYPSGTHDAGDVHDPADDQWSPVERADRAVVLVRGPRPYVVVADDLSADGASAQPYTWLLQLGPQSWGASAGSGAPEDPFRFEFNGGQQLLVTMVAPQMPYAVVDWHPDALSHLQLSATMAPAVQGQFLALLQPQRYYGDIEQPMIARLTVDHGVGAEIYWSDGYDRVLARQGAAMSSADGSWTDARLLWVRWEMGVGLTGWLAAEGTQAFVGPLGLYDSGGLATSAALSYGRIEVQSAEQPAPLQIAAYGPWITEAWLNGSPVSHVRVGDYVLLPAECDGPERCNGIDDDCDGEIDEADASDARWWYLDDDDDGYGLDDEKVQACQVPSGYAGEPGDCDDDEDDIYPGAPEKCADDEDNDCNGLVDEEDPACAHAVPEREDSTMWTCGAAPGSPRSGPTLWLLLTALAMSWRRDGGCKRRATGLRKRPNHRA